MTYDAERGLCRDAERTSFRLRDCYDFQATLQERFESMIEGIPFRLT